MRPTDEFGKDVGAYWDWITSEELEVLSILAQRRADSHNISIDLSKIDTVDDYIKKLHLL